MEANKESLIFHGIVSLFRQVIVLSIIVVVAALALFWESLPASVKKVVTSISTNPSDGNGIVPPKFRIDNHPKIDETDDKQSGQVESCSIKTSDEIIDNTQLARLHDELKLLGASTCRLTCWGDGGSMFRFSCQVPISEHHPNVTQTFQSIAPDAIQAIREVIEQIRIRKSEW